jgi:hypothetical protein
MLLDFFPASAGRRGSVFAPGERFSGELAFYPSQQPLRALLVQQAAAEDTAAPEWPAAEQALAEVLTEPLLAEPWTLDVPVLLPAGRKAEHRTVVPERLVGFLRQQRRIVDLDEVILCVDQSGSMATSVVYASIFAAVMASLPVVKTKLVCFDTAIVDLTNELADPVEVLFGVQLGGGTDINHAVAYCEDRIERPAKAHLVLITDLYEGGDADALIDRLARISVRGVNVIVLLALTDTGRAAYHPALSARVASLGIPVFACTPDQFPDLMATALRRGDISGWAAEQDIKLIRADA